MSDENIEPRPGRIRGAQKSDPVQHSMKVLRQASRAGYGRRLRSDVSPVGPHRGLAAGSYASVGLNAAGSRRVVVRARYSRIKAGDLGAAKAHLRYILRHGTTRDGQSGTPYDRDLDQVDIDRFLARSAGDPHQFRFIIAPEDSARLTDLQPFIRDLMAQAEQDLGTRLDWVAVDHFNTGHPHTHIVVRGRDQSGNGLIIDRSYISYGLRARAQGLMTLELGPESKLEHLQKLSNEVTQERFTRLDRSLLARAKDNVITLSALSETGSTSQTMQIGRLQKLARLGLAEERQRGVWFLAADIQAKLRNLGDRADKIKMMQRALKEVGLERAINRYTLFERGTRSEPLTGKIVGSGFIDEMTDRRYLVLDGVDGRVHYAEIGRIAEHEMPQHGMIIWLGGPAMPSKPSSDPKWRILSMVNLERLPHYDGVTWLDDLLLDRKHSPIGASGFGAEVQTALEKRLQWLIQQGLSESQPDGQIKFNPNLFAKLRRREFALLGQDLSQKLGVAFQPSEHTIVTGIYEKYVITPMQKLAVIRTKDAVTLAPWRPALERRRGRSVAANLGQLRIKWQQVRKTGLSNQR